MRKGISIEVTPADRGRLQSIVRDRNSPQKHVWRARIVLLSGDGLGTMAIMRAVGKGKTVVWRWQQRFMAEGVAGLTRDKTRPSRIAPLPAETVDRVIELTNQPPPHQATHWTAPAMAKAVAISPSSVRRDLGRAGFAAASGARLQALQRPQIRRQAQSSPRARSKQPRPHFVIISNLFPDTLPMNWLLLSRSAQTETTNWATCFRPF